MKRLIDGVGLVLKQGDITLEVADAIVNAANASLMGGGGVDGAIHRAGGPAILEACKKIIHLSGPLQTGGAVITCGGNLPARYVIHTVGPVWRGGELGEDGLLRDAYQNSLALAVEYGVERAAFPSISTGAYGFPLDRAAWVAIQAVFDFIRDWAGQDAKPMTLREVCFVLFSASDLEIYSHALEEAD